MRSAACGLVDYCGTDFFRDSLVVLWLSICSQTAWPSHYPDDLRLLGGNCASLGARCHLVCRPPSSAARIVSPRTNRRPRFPCEVHDFVCVREALSPLAVVLLSRGLLNQIYPWSFAVAFARTRCGNSAAHSAKKRTPVFTC